MDYEGFGWQRISDRHKTGATDSQVSEGGWGGGLAQTNSLCFIHPLFLFRVGGKKITLSLAFYQLGARTSGLLGCRQFSESYAVHESCVWIMQT